MNLNPELLDIQAAVRAGHSVTVEAGAGCGKTTAIVKVIAPELPLQTVFLAFNKSIQTELEQRLPNREVKTFHSLALSALTKRLGRLPINANKYKQHPSIAHLEYDDRSLVSDIISEFQLSNRGAQVQSKDITFDFFLDVLDSRLENLEPTENLTIDEAISYAYAMFAPEIKKPSALTFDDMLWFLVHYAFEKRWSLRDYKCVVIDEAQDVSPIRLAIVKLLAPRCIAVGDRRQAIYKFAGAMSTALDEIGKHFNSVQLPLSMTWRCSSKVVEWSSHILGESFLKARPDAPEGLVSETFYEAFLESDLDMRSMVLCRTNKPLVVLAIQLLKRRIPFRMQSDFPQKLIKKVERIVKANSGGMAKFRTLVVEHYSDITANLKSPNVIARYEDERDCILALSEECRMPEEIKDKLEQIMSSKYGILLTTAHKSKGLEADTVYILAPELIPAPWVPEDAIEDMQQETNLHYVMATRAKTALLYIGAKPL
ncbi:MAG: rep helicase [Siphoviridae sp. ct7UA22]|nr:MAG: rep helicase [Siphoviridae sp. ct7UA22]